MCSSDLSISAYTKNWLVSWSDNKELSLGADVIGWNSLKKKKGIDSIYLLPSKTRYINSRGFQLSSIGEISNGWIRDLGFNLRLHQKLIGVLVWWYRVIIRSGRHRLKLSFFFFLKKKTPLIQYLYNNFKENIFHIY